MPSSLTKVINVLLQEIVSPAVWLLMTLAFFIFIWGIVQFIWKGGSPEARNDGQKHMFWGIIGIAIMLSVFGIMHFIFGTVTSIGGTTGINNQQVNEPQIDKGFGGYTGTTN